MFKSFKNPNKVNKESGMYAKLRSIRNGETEAVITYHFKEEITHNDYGGDKNPKNNKFKVVSEPHREWKQQSTINPQIFVDEKGRYKQLDDVISLFVDLTIDLGAQRFTI